jgi:hypothetical protein
VVSGELSSWWYLGTEFGRSGDMYHASTYIPCLLQGPSDMCFCMHGILDIMVIIVQLREWPQNRGGLTFFEKSKSSCIVSLLDELGKCLPSLLEGLLL